METQLNEISEQQKASWNKFSPGWKKWDELMMDFLNPYSDEMITMLNPAGSDYVLDIASGTGEPGFTIANRLTDGKVVLTDLSEGMLEVAREHAAKKGITNIETKVCDVNELPFDDNTFDVVSCRLGFMFFPDMQQAANEMARVLKPGGRVATVVWGAPEKNFWVTSTLSAIKKFIDVPPPPPGAPGMFRCAEDGIISGLFSNAGLNNVTEKEVTGKLNMESAELYWEMMMDVAAPFVSILSNADAETVENVKQNVISVLNERYPDTLSIDGSANVIYGEK